MVDLRKEVNEELTKKLTPEIEDKLKVELREWFKTELKDEIIEEAGLELKKRASGTSFSDKGESRYGKESRDSSVFNQRPKLNGSPEIQITRLPKLEAEKTAAE